MKTHTKIALALVACAAAAITAYATVTIDENGYGFVGKGDVQSAFNWNNDQLQTNASGLSFSLNSSESSTWTCTKDDVPVTITQHRSNSQSVAGVVAYDARKNKVGQITGFTLNGFDGDVVTTTDGPEIGSCPAEPSGFVFDEGSLETTVDDGGTFQVCLGTTCNDLTITQ
jgi:hypothetical protein